MTNAIQLNSYAIDQWQKASPGRIMLSAVDSSPVAILPETAPGTAAMVNHARKIGGPGLRALNFQERGALIRSIADALSERKEELYALSTATGATRADSAVDIEGGIGTLFVYASKARKLPEAHVLVDSDRETLSKGDFLGQHYWTSRRGVAVHINAYNFPIWGMLEKLAPTLLAGIPAIIKPASQGSWLSHAAFSIIIDSGILPEGALQLLVGPTGDFLDHLEGQDVVAFTGSAETGSMLRTRPNIIREGVRFMSEQDSLNASILAPDATPDSPEFNLYVKEVAREMTQKAGQKCTAIRRALVPAESIDAVQDALIARLQKTTTGNPANKDVRMGALAGLSQREDVRKNLKILSQDAAIVHGGEEVALIDADAEKGAFFGPTLLRCDDPMNSKLVHEVEAFGPVSTLMPYADLDEAATLAQMGKGSLALSIFTHDPETAAQLIEKTASSHGRIMVVSRDNAEFSTGHGSALPHLLHGGPGRAGGCEELGGLIGMKSYMQRSAVQGSEDLLSRIAAL